MLFETRARAVEIRHFHLFCGLGGGARGFNHGRAQVGSLRANFRCIGGIDSDAAAIRDFHRLSQAPGTVMDLFSRQQYRDWHGHEPPADWHEATPDDIRKAAGYESPHILFTSPPCKGLSSLLSEAVSRTPKYQALNQLTVRGLWLALEAFKDDPVPLIVMENVPRILQRGRQWLDRIEQLLVAHGYGVAMTVHDCGEVGGLAQHRKRFLLVARHLAKVPAFLYEPDKRRVRAVGELLASFPVPDEAAAGPLHRTPALTWRTWIRLALVEAGSDWRSLHRLKIAPDGTVEGLRLVPVLKQPSALRLRDPTFVSGGNGYGQYGVCRWDATMGTISAGTYPGQGGFALQDPRVGGQPFSNTYRVAAWDEAARTVTAQGTPSAGGISVADPRCGIVRGPKDAFVRSAHYGVRRWADPTFAVTSAAGHDNGSWSIADPRVATYAPPPLDGVPSDNQRLVTKIIATDQTWHRPFTTLELAALQGLVDPDDTLRLDGTSDQAWRERIGNAVPPPAAQAIASVMGETLLRAWSGQSFALSASPIWVRPLAVAVSVQPALH